MPTTKRPNQARLVAAWNAEHLIGTPVEYWTFTRDTNGTGKKSYTRTEAQLLSGHTAVVWMVGEPSCVALSHVRPIPTAELLANVGQVDPAAEEVRSDGVPS